MKGATWWCSTCPSGGRPLRPGSSRWLRRAWARTVEGCSPPARGGHKFLPGGAGVATLEGGGLGAGTVLAAVVRSLKAENRLDYFDLTVNAEPAGPLWDAAQRAGMRFGNWVLRRPAK